MENGLWCKDPKFLRSTLAVNINSLRNTLKIFQNLEIIFEVKLNHHYLSSLPHFAKFLRTIIRINPKHSYSWLPSSQENEKDLRSLRLIIIIIAPWDFPVWSFFFLTQ